MPLNPNAPIEVTDYDPNWPAEFANLKEVLLGKLDHLCLDILHVGSTSVPNLAAKPILDIDIVIENDTQPASVIKPLQELGYTHQGDLGIRGREAFSRADKHTPYTLPKQEWIDHHLYVCPQDSSQLQKHLALRDYLRKHPDAAAAYSRLKWDLAVRHRNDRSHYTEAKTEFIQGILTKLGV